MATDLSCLSSSPTATLLASRFPKLSSISSWPHKTLLPNPKAPRSSVISCVASESQYAQITQDNTRRSANYQPNLWNFELLQSLEHDLKVGELEEQGKKLEEEVRGVMNRAETEPLILLELIDNVQRLGLTYMFEEDIVKALQKFVPLDDLKHKITGLHATALCFRLLRQHGFQVSQDVFERFTKEGHFSGELEGDVEGLLSLYEASYVGFEGETLLEEGRAFSETHLRKKLNEGAIEKKVGEEVIHALELAYHRRVQRLEARLFIDRFQVKEAHDGSLLKLAKLDFNRVQSLHRTELGEMSRWWREMGLASRLEFVRDRLMEVYFWAVGMAPHPEHSECRKAVTKMFGLVTIIDDVYDVYGTLDELELFTDAVQRWDVNAVSTLPDYMKLCFLALHNSVNDTGYSILKEKGHGNNLPYLIQAWQDLCKAFLQEAKWSNQRIIPEFRAYLDNASVSSSGVSMLAPSYFSVLSQDQVTDQALQAITDFHGIVRSSCAIFRLCNDLATSAAELERGETTNSITSLMKEKGMNEEEAREELGKLIDIEWRKLNKEEEESRIFPKAFTDISINLARVSHCTYQFGDGLGRPDGTAEKRIKLLFIDPLPIN